jgi:hypothetical protein
MSEQKPTGRTFISLRRTDTAHIAGRLSDRLELHPVQQRLRRSILVAGWSIRSPPDTITPASARIPRRLCRRRREDRS